MNSFRRYAMNLIVYSVLGCGCLFSLFWMVACFTTVSSSFASAVHYLFAVSVIWLVLDLLATRCSRSSIIIEILAMVAVCVILQVYLVKLLPFLGFNENGVGWDYRRALAALEAGKFCYVHNVRHTYWCNYEIVLSGLTVLFGKGITVGQYLNSVVRVAVLCLMAIVLYRQFKCRVARFVCLLWAFSPILGLTSMLLTGEFVSAAFMFLSFICINKFFNDPSSFFGKRYLARGVLCGFALGCSNLFKSITFVFWLALFVLVLLRLLSLIEKRQKLLSVLMYGVVFVSFGITQKAGQETFCALVNDCKLGSDMSAGGSDFLYELALGLNLETEGRYNDSLALKLRASTVKDQCHILCSAISRDWKHYPELMKKKFMRIHGAPTKKEGIALHSTYYFRDYKKDAKTLHSFCPPWMESWTDAELMIFTLIFMLGVIGMFVMSRRSCNCDAGIFAMTIVLVFAFVEQVIEGYGRYKLGIYPFYYMVLPYASVAFEKIQALVTDAWMCLCRTRLAMAVTNWINDER